MQWGVREKLGEPGAIARQLCQRMRKRALGALTRRGLYPCSLVFESCAGHSAPLSITARAGGLPIRTPTGIATRVASKERAAVW